MSFEPTIIVMKNGNLCLDVPIEIKHKNGRKLIIAPKVIDGVNAEAESPVQDVMAQALARAHAWTAALESQEVRNLQELSEKLNIDRSSAGRIMQLVNLAPDIQEAIINGSEKDGLSLSRLKSHIPDEWCEQRRLFGAVEKTAEPQLI